MSKQVKGTQALLIWCKRNTEGYKNVCVENFHKSWRDGLAFCALVHKFHPEMINFNSLSKDNAIKNNEIAFIAAEKLGVPSLLEAEDMLIEPKPDQFSVMTYISQMYHVFETKSNPGMGIANIAVDGANNPTGNATTTPGNNPTSKNSPRNSTAQQSNPTASLPAHKQPTNPPATPSKPANTPKNTPSTPSHIPSHTPSPASRGSGSFITPNRNQQVVEDKAEVNLQMNNKKQQAPVQQQPVDPDSCVKCHLPLEGEVIEALEKPYHQKCFGCHKCGKALKAKFVPIEGWPYCEGCGRQAFVTSRLQRRSQAVGGPTENQQQEQRRPPDNQQKMEAERAEKEREERDKTAKAEREAKDKQERERKERDKQEQERKESEERERRQLKDREEKERQLKTERERKDKEDKDRRDKEERDKQERERKDKEKQDQARRDKERQDQEVKEREGDRMRKEREEKMQKEREEAERVEKEREEAKKQKEKPKVVVVTLTAPTKLDKNSGAGQIKQDPKIEAPEKATGPVMGKLTETSSTVTTILTAPSRNRSSSSSSSSSSSPAPSSTTQSATPAHATTPSPSSSSQPSSTPSHQTFQLPATNDVASNRKSTYIQEHIKKEKAKREAEEKEEQAKRDAEKAKKDKKEAQEKDEVKKEKEKERKAAEEREAKIKQDAEKKEAEERSRREREHKGRAAAEETARREEERRVMLKNEETNRKREEETRERERKDKEERARKDREEKERKEKQEKEKVKEREERERREREEREKVKERDREQDKKQPSPKAPPLKRETKFNIDVKKELPPLPPSSSHSVPPIPSSLPSSPSPTLTRRVPPLPLTPTSTPAPPFPSPSPSQEKVLMEGMLMKQQATGLVRMWQQRYFILHADRLVYFRNHLKPNTPPHGTFNVRLIHSVENLSGSKFALLIEDKVWNFEAETDEEKYQWINALNFACQTLEPVPVPSLNNTTSDKIMKKEGWLHKLGFFGSAKVWVVLRGGVISYSETQGGKQQGRVLLYKCKLEEYDPKHKQNCFMATPLHESSSLSIFKWSTGIIFQAKDEMEMHEWLNEVVKQKVMIEDTIDNFEVVE